MDNDTRKLIRGGLGAIIALLLIWVVSSAVLNIPKNPIYDTVTTNPQIKIELLFEMSGGRKVYRFYDAGEYRYFVVESEGF